MNTRAHTALGLLACLAILSRMLLHPPGLSPAPRPISLAPPSGAYQALRFWAESRAYPEKDVPDASVISTFLERRNAGSSSRSAVDPGTEPWVSIGPTNFSGRMISIAVNPVDPKTILVGAAAGGLWRTTSAGLGGWEMVPTGYPVLGVSAITYDTWDTDVIYIGTGEVYSYDQSSGGLVVRTTRGSYGMGLLKSTDGGSTWTKSIDWSYNQTRGVQDIALNPLNSQTVFAGTSEGVYRSTDAGTTWAPVLDVIMVRDVEVNPQDTTLVLAACGNFGSAGHGIYRSTDGGLTFGKVSGLPSFTGYPRLELWSQNPDIVYASLPEATSGGGSLHRSTDFGASWTLLSTQAVYGVQGWYSQFTAVHPIDTNLVVRGGQSIYRSTNGGRNSSTLAVGWADYHGYAHDPSKPDILWFVDDGGVWTYNYRTGASDFRGAGLLTSQFYNGFSGSAQDSFLAHCSVQDHFRWMYLGSTSWTDGGYDEVGWTAVDQKNDSMMYFCDRNGGSVYKSTDRGANFVNASMGLSGGGGAWNSPLIASPSDPLVLYFGRSVVFRSTNGAATWQTTNNGVPLDNNPALSMAMSHSNPDTVYVGTAPRVTRAHMFRTTDGGATWVDITGPLPDRYPMDIAVDPTRSEVVYAAMGGFSAPHLWKTTDAGVTWSDITGSLPDVPATAAIVDPLDPRHVYVGTDLGAFVSTDAGTSWEAFGDGLPEAVIVSDLSISPSSRMLRCVTHSNGVYERPLLLPGVSGVVPQAGHAAEFALEQNYPNPFNPSTAIVFYMGHEGHARLAVYDIAGRRVALLADGRREPGKHAVRFDASGLSSGVYVYRLEVRSGPEERRTFAAARKMVLTR